MSECCDKGATSITPFEIPFATEECPLGTVSTNCIIYDGEDETYTGLLNKEPFHVSLNKLIGFTKTKLNNVISSSLDVIDTVTDNGTNVRIEVAVSSDEGNQLVKGTDGKLYSIPFPGHNFNDTNTIDFTKSENSVSARVKLVQSPTVNLSSTPSGIKADLSVALLQRITQLENRIIQLENRQI